MHCLISLLISRIRSFLSFAIVFRCCTRARILSSFSFLPSASDAAVPSGAAAHLCSMLSAAAAAAGAADASAVAFPSASSAFASWFAAATPASSFSSAALFVLFPGSASLTLCSRSRYFCCFSSSLFFALLFSHWRLGLTGFAFFFFLRDFESCHDTSVIASHMDCIVRFGVSAPFVVFSVCQDVIQLLFWIFLMCSTSLVSVVPFCTSCSAPPVCSGVATESSILLCNSLCSMCSDRRLTTPNLLLDQARH